MFRGQKSTLRGQESAFRGQESPYRAREERSISRQATPSNRSKYDNYTPRKRYIKEQQDYDQYINQSKELSQFD